MKITVSLPDPIAQQFHQAVPPRQRSRLVARLLEKELSIHSKSLAVACHAANRDEELEREIDEWQAFDEDIAE
ncbi:MAG: hypothetical protein HUU16_00420 [Candidatus Omnitrophica bacterium]|nr:hypothetical protein [Candidatus Omnitrophota bacterium]